MRIKSFARVHPLRVIFGVGFATFFFGFGAAAIFNYYLIFTHSIFIAHLRGSLNYKSAIFGDGIVLPLVNMLVASFILKYSKYVTTTNVKLALVSGAIITGYFHITQAMQGLVNWAMPTPWHWNLLGLWHAIYMYSVTSFLSLFYILLIYLVAKQKIMPKRAVVISAGIVLFFMLLKLDYAKVNLKQALSVDISQTHTRIDGLIQSGDTALRRLSPIPQIPN